MVFPCHRFSIDSASNRYWSAMLSLLLYVSGWVLQKLMLEGSLASGMFIRDQQPIKRGGYWAEESEV